MLIRSSGDGAAQVTDRSFPLPAVTELRHNPCAAQTLVAPTVATRRPVRRSLRRTSSRPSVGDQVVGRITAVLFTVLLPLSIVFAIMRAQPVAGTLLFLAIGGVVTAIGAQRYKTRQQERAIWAARA